jgi:hypothetical protein
MDTMKRMLTPKKDTAKPAPKNMAMGGMAKGMNKGMTTGRPGPTNRRPMPMNTGIKNMAKGGCVKMASGGSASKRADGCAVRGKTRA